MAELRRVVDLRVQHEDCPIVKIKERFDMTSDKATTTAPQKSKDNREPTKLNILTRNLGQDGARVCYFNQNGVAFLLEIEWEVF